MRDDLLAYLLGELSPEQRARIETRLAADPHWRRELKRLRQCLESADPESAAEPPSDLARRTCSFVQQSIHPPAAGGAAEPGTLTESQDPVATAGRWSLADFTVAAAILLVLAMLLVPALCESRATARRLACQAKICALGTAVVHYAQQRNGELPRGQAGENTGMFVVELADRGGATRAELAELLVCPASQLAAEVFAGRVVLRIPTRQQLVAATADQRQHLCQQMAGSFAYRTGYRDAEGTYRHVSFQGCSQSPLLADAPDFSVAGFQSANHGGCGQNVLYQDLSIRYHRLRLCRDRQDHLFLNANNEHAAGCHPQDVVLLRSEAIPVR